MMNIYSQGKNWNDYLARIEKIDEYTKQDIVNIANKYFTGNYLDVTKKTGSYPKDYLEKPGFEPIIPKHNNAESAYSKELEKLPLLEARPKFIDFNKDLQTMQMTDKVTLYVTPNPANDIFSFYLVFGKGAKESKLVSPLSSYLNYLGTDKYTHEEFHKELQRIGSAMYIYNDSENVYLHVNGLDENFEQTMEVVVHFMKHVDGDK